MAIDGGGEGADELVVRGEEVESRDEVLCAREEGRWLWSPCAQNKPRRKGLIKRDIGAVKRTWRREIEDGEVWV